MPEPHIDPDFSDLDFRSRARAPSRRTSEVGRFYLGIAVFLVVALVYPFYSYEVQSRLMAPDDARALGAFAQEVDAVAGDAERMGVDAARRHAAARQEERLRRVAIAGSTVVRGERVVIVTLGQASLAEAGPTICRQAERRFGTSLARESLRVQIHRGNAPAADAGHLRCGE